MSSVHLQILAGKMRILTPKVTHVLSDVDLEEKCLTAVDLAWVWWSGFM